MKNGSRKEKRICSTSGKLHCVPDAGEDDDFLAEKFVPDLFVCESKTELNQIRPGEKRECLIRWL